MQTYQISSEMQISDNSSFLLNGIMCKFVNFTVDYLPSELSNETIPSFENFVEDLLDAHVSVPSVKANRR